MGFRSGLAFLGLSFALSAALRVPYFSHSFIFVDEAWWANGAKALLQGGRLYRDIWLDKQPPIFLFCAALFKLAGVNMHAIHAGSLLLAFTLCALLFLMGLRLRSPAVGAAAALIYAVASTTYYTPRIMGMTTEALMVVFTAAGMLCFLKTWLGGPPGFLVGAGFLASLAAITKPVGIMELILFFLLLLTDETATRARRIGRTGLICSGSLLAVLSLFAYLLGQGILGPWWEQSILYVFYYVGQINASDYVSKMVRAPLAFGAIYFWLLLLIWCARATLTESPRAYRPLLGWLLSAFIGVAIGRRFYANYFIQVLPPMAILGGVGAVALWKNRFLRPDRLAARWAGITLLLSFIWFHTGTIAHWYLSMDSLAHSRIRFWGMCRENQVNTELAAHIRDRSSPPDRLFIWGPRPELYFLSNRPMATPFMEYDVGADVPRHAGTESRQRDILRLLDAAPPRYIVDYLPGARLENSPTLAQLLKDRYFLEIEMQKARIYRLRDCAEECTAPLTPLPDKAADLPPG